MSPTRKTNSSLERLLTELSHTPSDLVAMPRRIELCQRALDQVDREAQPELWAQLQCELGLCLYQTPRGGRAQNMQEAIDHFLVALEVYTRQRFSEEWAAVQHNLATIYMESPGGVRWDNLERAIKHYQAALEVYTPQGFPQEWGAIQNNLGNVYAQRVEGERAANLADAIRCYERALKVWTRERNPLEWALAQVNLGTACLQLPSSDDAAKNWQRACACYQQALVVCTRKDHPQRWAEVQDNLGMAWKNCPSGNRAENLEQAIAYHEVALEVLEHHTAPLLRARVQHNLGAALESRICGDRAENLERALKLYQVALKVRTRKAHPEAWAQTTHNLAHLYCERIRGNHAENLEKAIRLYREALEVRTRENSPTAWAATWDNLGNAYARRVRGDRADNLERAIEHYKQVLEVRTQEACPTEWAETQHNLAAAYQERLRGARAGNLEQAVTHYHEALKVHAAQTWPTKWATAQNDLANAYWKLGNHKRAGDELELAAEYLEKSIACYENALIVFTRSDFPVKWAQAHNNLANAYSDRLHGDQAENLEKAIELYQSALTVRTKEALPVQWAQTQNNLGTAYWERVCGDRKENLEEAVRCFCRALGVHTLRAFPVDARRAARNLANLYFEEERWSQAHDAYATALRAAEILYRASHSPSGKEAELTENTALYQRMVQTCLEESDYIAALVAAEGGKARTFLDQMGQAAFPPPTDLPAALLQREKRAVEELRGQEQDLARLSGQDVRADRERGPSREREIVDRRQKTLAALETVWDEIAHDYPTARGYVAMRRGEPITWDNLCALTECLGADTAMVEFYTLPDEIVVFVLYVGREVPWVHRVQVSQRQLRHRVVSFFREVAEHPSYPTLNQTWQRLASSLLNDVIPYLKDAKLVYLIPHGLLHYLPLHALEVDGAPLVEHFPLAYAPSAAVMGRLIEQAEERATNGSGSTLVVGNPTEDLPFAESEAQIIARHFGVCPYLRQEATKDRVVEKVKGRRNAHLACHGYFQPLEPLQSGIVLHDGVLTAQEILALRLQTELLVLSACQTAQQEVGRGDELMGLTRTLLYAGASSLVVSLWSVNDRSTGELMQRFYDILYGESPSPCPSGAEALRQAMLDIRRQPGWEHPYYWAPFILVGGM